MNGNGFSRIVILAGLFLGMAVASVQGTLVDAMNTAFPWIKYYHGSTTVSNSYFQIKDYMPDADPTTVQIVSGQISTVGYEGYNYQWSGTYKMTPCELKQDLSGSGWAKGKFYAGDMVGSDLIACEITLKGDLWAVSDPATKLITNGDILKARMVIHVPDMPNPEWILSEESPTPNRVAGTVYFSTIGGDLLTGALSGLTYGDFRADYIFNNSSSSVPPISVFGNQTFSCQGLQGNVHFQGIPEPATAALLGMGLLVCRTLRRKTTRVVED